MKWRLIFLAALLLPEAPLHPFDGSAAAGWPHLLGTDELGRDALLRLGLAGGRSLGFASACALMALALAWALAALRPMRDISSALRGVPPLLLLIPLAATVGGLGWPGLACTLALLLALQLEAPLGARLDRMRATAAWANDRIQGASPLHRLRSWLPWAMAEGSALFPTAWIGALWGEATLSALGLGPGPEHDSLGRLLHEELPRLSTDPTALGWAALLLILALACTSQLETRSWT